jgi:hypothetical protein
VGPKEKDAFVSYLNQRLRDRKLAPLVKNLFRPSYGGNRNVALMYSLGGLVISADDDMRPYALVEDSGRLALGLPPPTDCRLSAQLLVSTILTKKTAMTKHSESSAWRVCTSYSSRAMPYRSTRR